MIRLDAATVLLQWATGGLAFLWVTTRRRQVGIGYGWLLRAVYIVMLAGSVAVGRFVHPHDVRDGLTALTALGAFAALVSSVVRRRAGVAGERELEERRKARVAAMVNLSVGDDSGNASAIAHRREFDPALDLIAPLIGVAALVAAGAADGGPFALAVARTIVGAAFLGAVTDAMLLGHWYLVQPGLGRGPLSELTLWVAAMWPLEMLVLLWPTGMLSALSGSVDDGYGGLLGWFWVACAASTIVLCGVTWLALKERAYSAVMAATGLLYLAILTAFGTDLVARAILAR
jgi:hypothetical protein